MGFDRDMFADYEKEYLERLGVQKLSPAEIKHVRHLADIRRKYGDSDLGADDRFVLEMIQRGDLFAQLGMGTMRLTESMLRLYCHGMIAASRSDELPFDERERLQAFQDSELFRRYQSNLKKTVGEDDAKFFKAAAEVMGVARDNANLALDVTDAGRRKLEEPDPPHYSYGEMNRRYVDVALSLYGGPGGANDVVRPLASYGLGLLAGFLLTDIAAGGHSGADQS